jgi:hypothetical protein
MAARKKSNRKRAARKSSARRKSGRKKGAKRKSAKKAGKKKSPKRKAPKRGGKKKAAGKRKSAPKKKSAKKATTGKAVSSPPASTPAAGGGASAEVRPFRVERPAAPAQPSSGMGSGPSGMGAARSATPAPAAGVPSPLAPGDVSDSEPHRVGVVTHYYEHAGACVVSLDAGELRVGDTIHVRGHTTDFYQRVDRMERDHVAVDSARVGEEIGVQVGQRVRSHDAVFRLARRS